MSTLVTTDTPVLDRAQPSRRPAPGIDGGPTLDDVVSRTWEVLRAAVPASCLVCGADVEPRDSAGVGFVGGRCDSCGTTLG